MSYGKILQAIITPLSWGYLTHMYTDTAENHHAIWLYDGSIGFFTDPGHIMLAVFAILMLLCLFLPYTLVLLCGHYLQAWSYRISLFSWINKSNRSSMLTMPPVGAMIDTGLDYS
jgi:hypothetical protein